jgi:hypothetical protein
MRSYSLSVQGYHGKSHAVKFISDLRQSPDWLGRNENFHMTEMHYDALAELSSRGIHRMLT